MEKDKSYFERRFEFMMSLSLELVEQNELKVARLIEDYKSKFGLEESPLSMEMIQYRLTYLRN